MVAQLPPLLNTLTVKRADFVGARFVVEFEDEEFLVVADGERVSVFSGSTEGLVGIIRAGGPTSGAIWVSGGCVAEYMQRDQVYAIFEIEDGFRALDASVSTDPLAHLLQVVRSNGEGAKAKAKAVPRLHK